MLPHFHKRTPEKYLQSNGAYGNIPGRTYRYACDLHFCFLFCSALIPLLPLPLRTARLFSAPFSSSRPEFFESGLVCDPNRIGAPLFQYAHCLLPKRRLARTRALRASFGSVCPVGICRLFFCEKFYEGPPGNGARFCPSLFLLRLRLWAVVSLLGRRPADESSRPLLPAFPHSPLPTLER